MRKISFWEIWSFWSLLSRKNPKSSNIQILILQTNLHTFPYISWENLFKKIKQSPYKKLQPFFKDFPRTTLDFQGPPTKNIISQIVQKCTFPVYSNKTLS